MEQPIEDNVVPMTRTRGKSPRARTPNDDVWDACEAALGYGPLTESEKKLWGRMVASLTNAGATTERIDAVAKWYHRHWPQIDLTITALEKWYSHFLAMSEKKERRKKAGPAVCPECDLSPPHHTSYCSRKQS